MDWRYTQRAEQQHHKEGIRLGSPGQRSRGRPRGSWRRVREKDVEKSVRAWSEIKKLSPRSVKSLLVAYYSLHQGEKGYDDDADDDDNDDEDDDGDNDDDEEEEEEEEEEGGGGGGGGGGAEEEEEKEEEEEGDDDGDDDDNSVRTFFLYIYISQNIFDLYSQISEFYGPVLLIENISMRTHFLQGRQKCIIYSCKFIITIALNIWNFRHYTSFLFAVSFVLFAHFILIRRLRRLRDREVKHS